MMCILFFIDEIILIYMEAFNFSFPLFMKSPLYTIRSNLYLKHYYFTQTYLGSYVNSELLDAFLKLFGH